MKEQAYWLYRRFTSTSRERLRTELCEQSRHPLAVLFYHRIANCHFNDWTMSHADFARQLDWLQTNYEIVDLSEIQTRMRSGQCTRPTVAISFDDGYADNADFAIPELVRRSIPATYFVSTDYVATGNSFPHDLENGVALAPNTVDQLREFAEQGIEIGAHTKSHCNLGLVEDREVVEEEILGSRTQLESWLGRPVRYFAFPYGLAQNTSQLAVDVIREAGFEGFCTAYGAWNWPVDRDGVEQSENSLSAFHLKRIHADPGIESLANWLTLDSRKLEDQVELPFSVHTEEAQHELQA